MYAIFKSKKYILLILVSLLLFLVALLRPAGASAYQVSPSLNRLNSPKWSYTVPKDSNIELKELILDLPKTATLENQSNSKNYKKYQHLLYNKNLQNCFELKTNLQISNNLDIISLQKMLLITAFVLFYFNKLNNSKKKQKKQIIVDLLIRDINHPENFAVLINDLKREIYLLKGSVGKILSVSHNNPFKCQVCFQVNPPIYGLENSKNLHLLCSEALTFSKNDPSLKKLFNS